MRRTQFLIIAGALGLVALLFTLGFMESSQAGSVQAPAALTQAPLKELVIGLGREPETLFIYGSQNLDPSRDEILEALQDGPIDVLDYDYVPVILSKLPDVGDGDAVVRNVTVSHGDWMVVDGEVVTHTGTAALLLPQMVVTFTLRDDVRWCDGQALMARDSAFSFRVQRDSSYTLTGHFLTDRTYTYTQQGAYTARWVGLPGFLDATYFDNFWTPLPYHVLSDTLPVDIPTSSYARGPLGWGPFCFVEWITDHITLERNPYYWRPGLPMLDKLVFRWDTADDALLDDVVDGRVQVGLNIGNFGRVVDLDRADAVQKIAVPSDVWEHIDFNLDPIDAPTHTLPFGDVRVRQAIAYGTDRQRMIDEFVYGVGTPLNAFVPDSHPAYPAATAATYPYSPTAAANLLDAAGWAVMTDGMRYKDGLPLSFVHRTTDNPTRRGISGIFYENMAAIGVSVTLEFWNAQEFFSDGPDGPVFGRWFDTAEFAWVTASEPPGDLFLCDQIPWPDHWSGTNNTGYCNPAYDAAVEAAQSTLTRTESLAHWHRAVTTFTQELPLLPLHSRARIVVASPDLTGFELDPTENELWNVEMWDIVVTETITDGGGELVSNSGSTTVTFPTGAVSETVVVTLTPQIPPDDPPPGLGTTSHFFDLEAVALASGLPISFDKSVSVTIHYNDAEIVDLIETSLALYRLVDGTWEKIGTRPGESYTLDIENNLLTAYLQSFSRFGQFGTAINYRLYLPITLRNR